MTQALARQIIPAPQMLPQPPQLTESVVMGTQRSPEGVGQSSSKLDGHGEVGGTRSSPQLTSSRASASDDAVTNTRTRSKDFMGKSYRCGACGVNERPLWIAPERGDR